MAILHIPLRHLFIKTIPSRQLVAWQPGRVYLKLDGKRASKIQLFRLTPQLLILLPYVRKKMENGKYTGKYGIKNHQSNMRVFLTLNLFVLTTLLCFSQSTDRLLNISYGKYAV